MGRRHSSTLVSTFEVSTARHARTRAFAKVSTMLEIYLLLALRPY